jgi:hypothetical protein
MKHLSALEWSNALVSIVVDLLYLILIGNKKQGIGPKVN